MKKFENFKSEYDRIVDEEIISITTNYFNTIFEIEKLISKWRLFIYYDSEDLNYDPEEIFIIKNIMSYYDISDNEPIYYSDEELYRFLKNLENRYSVDINISSYSKLENSHLEIVLDKSEHDDYLEEKKRWKIKNQANKFKI